MKFATALLFAAVVAAEEEKKAEEKKGAKKGEACDASGTDKGCADGLRCHLGVAVTAAAAVTGTAVEKPKTCPEKKLGKAGWVVKGDTTVEACEFSAVAQAADFTPDAKDAVYTSGSKERTWVGKKTSDATVVTKTETGLKPSTDTKGTGWEKADPVKIVYTIAAGTDVSVDVNKGYQAPTTGWTLKDPNADKKKKAAEEAEKKAKEEAAKAPKKEETTTPQTGACGAEDQCDTTVSEVEIKCGAAKLGAGLLASLAIAASL